MPRRCPRSSIDRLAAVRTMLPAPGFLGRLLCFSCLLLRGDPYPDNMDEIDAGNAPMATERLQHPPSVNTYITPPMQKWVPNGADRAAMPFSG
jgi:hypothetical protein